MTATKESIEYASLAARAAEEKLGTNIALYDVSDVMAISDVFVVITGANDRQVSAIVEEVDTALSEKGQEPLRREGNRENRWVLLDYGPYVIHVQRVQEREFYGLDRLYADCPLIPVEGIEPFERDESIADAVNTRKVSSIDDIPLADEQPPASDEEYLN